MPRHLALHNSFFICSTETIAAAQPSMYRFRLRTNQVALPGEMNWNTNIAGPRFKSVLPAQWGPTSANLWSKCSEWDALPHHCESEHGENACPNCDHDMAIASRNCFLHLHDENGCKKIKVLRPPVDELSINDQHTHRDRLNSGQANRGSTKVVLLARFKIPET